MFGKGAGGLRPLATGHTASMVRLGGIAQKPGVVGGQIALREYLSLTLSFDHSIVDGRPGSDADLVFDRQCPTLRKRDAKELIESGYGLDVPMVKSEQAVSPGT